jgi:uncharacterized protein (DUF433 family)
MAQQSVRIVSDEDVMGGEPRIEGRRITVRQVAEWVEDRGLDARTVADRHDLDVAAVYRALAYYHEHPEEMAEVRADREDAEERALDGDAATVNELESGDT